MSLYIDDSGTRHPDRGGQPKEGNVPWFALGGILLAEEHEEVIRLAHREFYERWPQIAGAPLHSHAIRHMKGKFDFMAKDPALRDAFLADLTNVLTSLPVLGHASVIDRPGYMNRYDSLYRARRWLLCKTAFSVLLERVAKYARKRAMKLRVYVEKSGKREDGHITQYYKALRNEGMPFNNETSARYAPLNATELREVLYDLRFKNKTSALAQIADLYLFPICTAGYRSDRAYDSLKASGRLIDCTLPGEDIDSLGVKYSCFDAAPPFARRS